MAALGFVVCPLCNGLGIYEEKECSLCRGDRELPKHIVAEIDLQDFDQIDCPVCEGDGNKNGQDCPACGGEAKMERHFADRIDPKDFDRHYPSNLWFSANCSSVSAAMEEIAFRSHLTVLI